LCNFLGQFCQSKRLEAISKMHLASNGPRLEMLTYYGVRSAFKPQDALPLNAIYYF